MVLDTTDMADIEDTMERGLRMLSLQLNLQLMLMLMLGIPLTAMVLDMPTVDMDMEDMVDMDMADMVDMDILHTDHMVDTTTASNSRWGNNNSRSLFDDSPVTFTSFNRVFLGSIFSAS